MAIGFARVSVHTRSQGHSAVAGAAYRSGSKLYDSRTGETHNFQNRHDVIYSEVLLPEDAPQKFLNREVLWNAVEAAEKRKDAQLAKDVILALPRGLDKNDLISLAKEFTNYHFVSKGLAADIAIHDHGDGNPHAHIYVTTRRLHEDGFDLYKARDLNPSFANWRGGKGFITEQDYWGDQWRDFQNGYFEKNEIDLIVDENHLISQRHQGRHRFDSHYLHEENQLKRDACIEIALNDPDSLINIISQRYAVFSERQLASVIFKNTESQEQFDVAMHRVKNHKDIVCLGPSSDGKLHYTTRANYLKECKLADQAEKLSKKYTHSIKESFIEQAMGDYSLNTEQQQALSYVLCGADITAIVGRAGTGKSYLMKAAYDYFQQAGLEVKGISVSGVAAKGLQQCSGIPSCTIASFKLKVTHQNDFLDKNSVVVMDEAGMSNLADMAFVVATIKKAGAKLVLIGDPNQLQPIGPGAPFRALIERIGFVEMEAIQRQKNNEDRKASHQLAMGNIESALDYYEKKGAIHWHFKPQDAMNTLIHRWKITTHPDELSQQLILAHRNCDIAQLNLMAREALKSQKKLGSQEYTIDIVRRIANSDGWGTQLVKDQLPIAQGERLLFRRNDKALGVTNGDFGVVNKVDHHQLDVTLKDGRKISFNTKDYNEFDYGYAVTVHKAQGTTFDRVFVYGGGQGWNRHLAYVALTRHRDKVELHVDRETFQNKETLKEHFIREEIKDSVLDWPLSYARRRGFDPESLIGRLIEKMGHLKDSIKDRMGFIRNTTDQHKSKSQEGSQEKPKKILHPLKDNTLEWEYLKDIDQPQIKLMYQLYNASKNKTDQRSLDRIYNAIVQLAQKANRKPEIKQILTVKTPALTNKINEHIKLQKKRVMEKSTDY